MKAKDMEDISLLQSCYDCWSKIVAQRARGVRVAVSKSSTWQVRRIWIVIAPLAPSCPELGLP